MPVLAHGNPGRVTSESAAPRVLLALFAAWTALVVALYYEQLWAALAAGPSAWLGGTLDELRHTGIPYVREAANRAAGAAAAAALVVASMLAAGAAADRLLTPPGLAPHERQTVRFANGAAIVSLLLLALALAGVHRPAVVRSVVLALAALGIGLAVARRHAGGPRADFRGIGGGSVAAWAWTGITGLACAIALVTALAPETEYDALWYHLELPRQWLAAGRLTDNVHEYVSLYPGGWEMLFGAALAFDGAVAARLLHWCTLAAGAATAASIAGRALGARTGPLAAAVFVTAPTVLWEATTAYVDLALAMHAGIGTAALWQSARDRDPRWLALAGLQLGMACATKHLGLVVAAIAIGSYIAVRARGVGFARLARAAALVGLLTLLVPSPWYLRAWLASGNPVFPEMYEIFGASPPERWNDRVEAALDGFKARFGRPRTVATLATLPWDMTLHAWRYGGTLGPFLLLTLPAIAAIVWRSPPARLLAAGALVYLAIWASPISSFQLRFLVPWWLFVSALSAAALVLVHDAAARAWPPARWAAPALTAVLLLLNLPPWIPLHERDRAGWDRQLTHVVRRLPIEVVAGTVDAHTYRGRQIASYQAWRFLNAHAPAETKVLTFFGGDHLYAERARLWSEAPAAWRVTWDATDEAAATVMARLRRLGITHLLIPKRPPARTEGHTRLVLLRADVLSRFTLVYEDSQAAVYRAGAPPDGGSEAAVAGRAASTDHR